MAVGTTEQRTALGTLVRAWRERALLTQEQLAERSGMSARSIRRLESAEGARPRSSSLELLANALDLSADERSALTAAVQSSDQSSAVRHGKPARSAPAPPRQLPAPPPAFTGRLGESADLERMQDASAVVIASIDGMAGVGKTALAVHAAHRLADRYPDGQLFLDLHGYTEGVAPVEPGDALDRVLRALGVPGEEIPRELDERAAFYRSRLAGRRVLVVLDNAASEAQVAPLLPGTPGCLVIVTSRRRLAGLDHTHVVSLDVLPRRDAVALFSEAAGRGRTAGAPDAAVAEVVELCGRLPLAVRIAAARLRARPAWSVENLVEKLRDHRRRLVELETGSRSVAAALESSYQDLDPPVQRGYRLLGLHPGEHLDRYAAAALLDTDAGEADRLLDQLLDAHLLQEPTPGRFDFHDLVREHTRSTAARDEGEPGRRAALTRLLDHYRHTASVAMDVVYTHVWIRRPEVPPARTPAPAIGDSVRASAWLDRELSNLVAAARLAASRGWPEHAAQLGPLLHRHLYEHGHAGEAMTLHRHALDAARAAGDRRGEVDAMVLLGQVHFWFHSRLEPAGEVLTRAAATARACGYHTGEVAALTSLGHVRNLQGSHSRAAEHFAAARERARRVRDPLVELDALYELAWFHLRHGGPACEEFEECVSRAEAAGDGVRKWLAVHGLGQVHRMQGRFEEAADCFRRTLRVARTAGDEYSVLASLIGLASTRGRQGDGARAAGHYRRALELAREVGNPYWEFEAVHGLGRLACAAGRPEQAVAHFSEALAVATKLGQPAAEIRAHDGLAHARAAMGQPGHARRHWQHALDVFTDLGLTDLGADIDCGDRVTAPAIRGHLGDLDRLAV